MPDDMMLKSPFIDPSEFNLGNAQSHVRENVAMSQPQIDLQIAPGSTIHGALVRIVQALESEIPVQFPGVVALNK
ncbi:MAG: hypothetical protein JWP37_3218 [Mucilaginibacter sp.]|nr:hypothetical protein [Mucilaginibacter sp.]